MTRMQVEASAVIDARPEAIYAVLSDYHNEHPHILPPEYFTGLEVEQGGYGAGTVLRVHTRALGVERSYHMRVSEPEPGRVLAETDIATGLVTTFTVTPLNDGQQARVQIATEWEAAPGMAGLVDRWLTPIVMRRIYSSELRRLNAYMQSKQ